MHRHFISVTFLGLLLTACTGTTTVEDDSTPEENTASSSAVAFKVTQSGGCVMIGPNCAEHTLREDGSVEVRRIDSDGTRGEVEGRGTIDQGQTDSWVDLVANTDFDALKLRLPAGTCSGCLDGVDYLYTIYQQGNSVTINSLDYQFSEAEPFFAMTTGVYEAMLNAALFEIQQRSN